MKVWIVEGQDYEDTYILGIFSSEEIAKESLEHYLKAPNRPGESDDWYKTFSFQVYGFELDEYYKKHLSKLQRALK